VTIDFGDHGRRAAAETIAYQYSCAAQGGRSDAARFTLHVGQLESGEAITSRIDAIDVNGNALPAEDVERFNTFLAAFRERDSDAFVAVHTGAHCYHSGKISLDLALTSTNGDRLLLQTPWENGALGETRAQYSGPED
jgi:hypothetical protein